MGENTAPDRAAVQTEVHSYWDGEALEGDAALAVTQAAPTRVVVVAGPAESGKTTLVAGLYEAFHFGPVGKYLFAGSRSFVGFERRCHLARRSSGLENPDTERTLRAPTHPMLHLKVGREGGSSGLCDLLLTDVYGEAFRAAADSSDECRKLEVLHRADHVLILLDGAKIAVPRTRQEPFAAADSLLRCAVDAGMLGANSQVALAVTKLDLFDGGAAAGTRRFLNEKKAWLLERYRSSFSRLGYHEMAVRPKTENTLKRGHGLLALLDEWVSHPRRFPAGAEKPAPGASVHTEFDRFAHAWPAVAEDGQNEGRTNQR